MNLEIKLVSCWCEGQVKHLSAIFISSHTFYGWQLFWLMFCSSQHTWQYSRNHTWERPLAGQNIGLLVFSLSCVQRKQNVNKDRGYGFSKYYSTRAFCLAKQLGSFGKPSFIHTDIYPAFRRPNKPLLIQVLIHKLGTHYGSKSWFARMWFIAVSE